MAGIEEERAALDKRAETEDARCEKQREKLQTALRQAREIGPGRRPQPDCAQPVTVLWRTKERSWWRRPKGAGDPSASTAWPTNAKEWPPRCPLGAARTVKRMRLWWLITGVAAVIAVRLAYFILTWPWQGSVVIAPCRRGLPERRSVLRNIIVRNSWSRGSCPLGNAVVRFRWSRRTGPSAARREAPASARSSIRCSFDRTSWPAPAAAAW